jgi:hypothetical protein
VGDDDFKGLEGAEEVVVVAHEAEAVQEGLDDISLLGELDDVLAFQRKHDYQFGHDVCQLGNAGFVEPQEVVEDVDVDENGVGCVLALHLLCIPAADGVELDEKRRGGFSVGVEQDILEQRSHEVQVVEAEP